MLTKFILTIDDNEYELKDDDLKNWDEIQCSYKRSDYDGVVRSFSSQFEFVNKAKDILMELYLKDRYLAKATIVVCTMNDRLKFEPRFEAPLDFSTIQWDRDTLTLNSIDNSLAALIKANKSTKYEFVIGEDIKRNDVMNFDRLPMIENVTYKFTGGRSYDDSADLLVPFNKEELPYIGNVGEEIYINGVIDWKDDQTRDLASYVLRAVTDIDVSFDFEAEWRTDEGLGNTRVNIELRVRRNGSYVSLSSANSGAVLMNPGGGLYDNLGSFSSPSTLPNPSSQRIGAYATVNGIVWQVRYVGTSAYIWVNTGQGPSEYFKESAKGSHILSLKAGDQVVIRSVRPSDYNGNISVRFIKSKFVFQWIARGIPENIDVISPRNLGNTILRRICGDEFKADIFISTYDSRLANTYLMAAESIRGISNARIYSSFNEFCEWMQTVFGYVYYIGDPQPPRFPHRATFGDLEMTPWSFVENTYGGQVKPQNIIYFPVRGKFMYHNVEGDGTLYLYWQNWEDFNNPQTGFARTDTLFKIFGAEDERWYYFNAFEGGYNNYPVEWNGEDDYVGDNGKTLYFVHRSELFNPDAEIRIFNHCTEMNYTVDSASIYSSVTIGYEKKDYDSINGRDEFNFNNTYTTGCNVSDKTLSLLSKYRADSYGIEFAAQQRGCDTTDSSSDSDVFFVLCARRGDNLIPDRTNIIENSLTEYVFNGAFSPIACIMANAGIIGLQADSMTLRFASSTGNSDIAIDGIAMSSDLTIDTPIATTGRVEFKTDEVTDVAGIDKLIKVTANGITYRGFIEEVNLKYARTEAAIYKIIVKDITI